MSYGRVTRIPLVSFLILALVAPVTGWSSPLSMGSARGIRSVELSLDDGKNWLPLGSRSLPILDGTQLRTSNGGAVIDMSDGGRLNLLPLSFLRVREVGGTTQVSLVRGRLGFRLPRETRVEIDTPAARLEPVRTAVMRGELFVAPEGTVGLKMAAGSLQVHELSAKQPIRLAGLEPVFLPKRPVTAGPLFTSDAPASPPAGARGVFDPRGKSLGYLRPDAQLVVQPGYSSDLTRPFPPKLIQLAMAKIAEKDRSEAVPVFDVNGGYVGYVAGPAFHAETEDSQTRVAQAQIAQAQIAQVVTGAEPAGFLGMAPTTFFVLAGSLGAVVGVGAAAGSGAFSRSHAATPTGPNR